MAGVGQLEMEDTRDFCSLVTARESGTLGARLPLLIALHGRGGDARTERDRVRALFGPGPDIVALQAARPCNPMQSDFRAVAAYAGFSWYLGSDPSRPEAASFGDALAQLEIFVESVRQPFVLAGDEQGAALALTLALYAPAGLVGVHAARAAAPSIDGWDAPCDAIAEIRFMVSDAGSAMACDELLSRRGARAMYCEPDQLAPWLCAIAGDASE